eukprot:108700-Amorphochlora_amoeboformis.AAC.1
MQMHREKENRPGLLVGMCIQKPTFSAQTSTLISTFPSERPKVGAGTGGGTGAETEAGTDAGTETGAGSFSPQVDHQSCKIFL